jgi:hypothetical protein
VKVRWAEQTRWRIAHLGHCVDETVCRHGVPPTRRSRFVAFDPVHRQLKVRVATDDDLVFPTG